MKQPKFREMTTSSGTLILAGKDAKNNEELINEVKPFEEVFHTALPGSPFVRIVGKSKKGDIKKAAIFCAIHSRDWKKNKKDVKIHRFKGKDIYKEKNMKLGTYGIKNFKIINIKKEDILK
jgi:predicted ribosome quality control (RQC) complex YloA/Tae2 family protein|tara:strand:- start:3501 stop:3863 length:363 start_codon:yes stop_codon:yes gene_type:complete